MKAYLISIMYRDEQCISTQIAVLPLIVNVFYIVSVTYCLKRTVHKSKYSDYNELRAQQLELRITEMHNCLYEGSYPYRSA